MRKWIEDPALVRPMLATVGEAALDDPSLAYEPKYDGIRALVAVAPAGGARLWSRLGNEKTRQFPEIVEALDAWARRLDRPLLLDGEIVALDARGEPCGFQHLQGRIHLKTAPRVPAGARLAFIAFDLLRDGDDDIRPLPLRDRRARLEARLRAWTGAHADPRLRISDQTTADGRALYTHAQQHGGEGVIAKRLDAPYRSGRRSPEWRKLKLVRHQTCVVGGWTEPRGSRPFFGALLLGVYDAPSTRSARSGQAHLVYIGHTGAGFTDAELGRVWKMLQGLKTRTSPFATTPRTNERPYWVKPQLVAEVKFTEWTADGKLRHPTYVGMRDDVEPEQVRKEPVAAPTRPARAARSRSAAAPARPGDVPRPDAADRAAKPAALTKATVSKLLDQLDAIEDAGGDGVVELPGGRLEVSNLRKVFWPSRQPKQALTKGDLFRHYVRVAPLILPVVADRPLVLKRYPNGIGGKPFYQHRAPERIPPGVRVQPVASGSERRPHFIGGDVTTLLYTVQLASISQDPWFSRVGSEGTVDHVAIDLDPPDGVPFARVLDVARWVRDELDALGVAGFPKTSGSAGLHVYVPMPPGTPYDAGLLFCQIVATVVARKHPNAATVERAVAARGRRIYVDYLQNIQGKTLASAYSARANEFAGVSTPLTWDEVDEGVSPKDFTIRGVAARIDAVGDLWAALRKAKGADLRAVSKYRESPTR